MQGKANSQAFVTGFYIKYSMDGVSWDVYGDIPPAKYFVRTNSSGSYDIEMLVLMKPSACYNIMLQDVYFIELLLFSGTSELSNLLSTKFPS